MNNTDGVTKILTMILMIMSVILVITIIIALVLLVRKKTRDIGKKKNTQRGSSKETDVKGAMAYTKESIFDFMEFDTIEDNMIVQKNGKRYVMAIECQGVNYDLMSQVEKVSVEEGFQQFLNTLRHPIQIYIQTRTINLEKSITNYKSRVKDIELQYSRKSYEYNSMLESNKYNKEELDRTYYDLTKQRNLYEYARDIVDNTEKMSLNRNILSKKYYVIISYMPEEASSNTYDKEELRNLAFSELYTKSQALIRTLSGCSVAGKVLNSNELVELLYVAYNRDDSEIYGLDKALKAQYYDLYSTAPDVFKKKIKALDDQIRSEAVEKANKAIENVKNKAKAQALAEEKEKNMDELVSQMAKILIKQNKKRIGIEVADNAIEEINEEKKQEKGGKTDEKIKKTSTRNRKTTN